MTTFRAGQASSEVRWFTNGKCHDREYLRTQFDHPVKATVLVSALLRSGIESVTVIRWTHQHNLPGCLPEVVSKSGSLDVYTLVDDRVVERAVDIFERSY